MMLILSIVFVLVPLLGIVYSLVSGGGLTVDNLFLILILLTISGIFALNVFLELRKSALARKKAAPRPAADQKQAAKTT